MAVVFTFKPMKSPCVTLTNNIHLLFAPVHSHNKTWLCRRNAEKEKRKKKQQHHNREKWMKEWFFFVHLVFVRSDGKWNGRNVGDVKEIAIYHTNNICVWLWFLPLPQSSPSSLSKTHSSISPSNNICVFSSVCDEHLASKQFYTNDVKEVYQIYQLRFWFFFFISFCWLIQNRNCCFDFFFFFCFGNFFSAFVTAFKLIDF